MSISTRHLGKPLDMNHMLAFSEGSQHMNHVTENISAMTRCLSMLSILFSGIFKIYCNNVI